MKIFIIVLFVFFSNQLLAQPFEFLNYTEGQPPINENKKGFKHNLLNEIDLPEVKSNTNSDINKNRPIVKKSGKNENSIDYSLNVGMQVGTSFNNSYFTNNYIVPTVSFDLTNRVKLLAGIGYSFSRIDNMTFLNPNLELQTTSLNIHSISAFSTLAYELSPKTSVYASVLVEQSSFGYSSISTFNKTFTEGSLGLNYKVTPNISFNAQVSYGNRPYCNGSFSPNGYRTNPGFGF